MPIFILKSYNLPTSRPAGSIPYQRRSCRGRRGTFFFDGPRLAMYVADKEASSHSQDSVHQSDDASLPMLLHLPPLSTSLAPRVLHQVPAWYLERKIDRATCDGELQAMQPVPQAPSTLTPRTIDRLFPPPSPQPAEPSQPRRRRQPRPRRTRRVNHHSQGRTRIGSALRRRPQNGILTSNQGRWQQLLAEMLQLHLGWPQDSISYSRNTSQANSALGIAEGSPYATSPLSSSLEEANSNHGLGIAEGSPDATPSPTGSLKEEEGESCHSDWPDSTFSSSNFDSSSSLSSTSASSAPVNDEQDIDADKNNANHDEESHGRDDADVIMTGVQDLTIQMQEPSEGGAAAGGAVTGQEQGGESRGAGEGGVNGPGFDAADVAATVLILLYAVPLLAGLHRGSSDGGSR